MTLPRPDGCPGRPWSLLDMILTNAKNFVEAGEVLRMLDQAIAGLSPMGVGPTPLPQPQFETAIGIMKALSQHGKTLQLRVTPGLADQFVKDADTAGTSTTLQAYTAVVGARDAFKVELQSQIFLQVLPHRIPYYTLEHSGGKPVVGAETATLVKSLADFKDAHFDAIEAGNCIAFGRSTAAVYHLMRIAEYGLVAVATAANVTEVSHRSWDKMIAGIHLHIKTIESQKPDGWLHERKRFSELCSWLTVIKSGWRNPVSHIPRSYSEPTAMSMFSAVRTLFEHLQAQNFSPVLMPAASISPEDDDASGSSKQLPSGQSQTLAP